jgi:hypothetical protein
MVVMPPQWCRALPGSPFACCNSCAEELEERCLAVESENEQDQTECGCQCGKIAFKQPEEVAVAVYDVPHAMHLLTGAVSIRIDHSLDVPPPRNFQQLLCCWRN